MYRLHANGVFLSVLERDQITSGSAKVFKCQFTFEGEYWDELSRTAVFRSYNPRNQAAVEVIRECPLDSTGTCEIPWEVTKHKNRLLAAGVYGTKADGTVLPTIWVDLDEILPGAVGGEASKPPTPDVYAQYVGLIKADADRAAQAATDAEAAAQDVKGTGTQAVTDIGNAKDSALEAIGQTEQAAINQIQQAGATQASAVQSAGATQIGQVNSAGAAQVQAVKDEGATQTAALNDAAEAHKNELESIASHPPQPNTATGKWQTWNAETGAYQDTDALYQGGYYTPAVSDDGVLTWQGSQAGMPSLPSANVKGPQGPKGDPGLGVPTPTTSDAGKVPTVKTDGSAYELAGPYAPLSAAIRPTASGNPVSITDSVEWPLLGLKVYGKSTQVTTTGANLIDLPEFASNAYYNALDKSQYAGIYEQLATLKPGTQYRVGCSNLAQLVKFEIGIIYDDDSMLTIRNSNQTGEAKNTAISSVIVYLGSTESGERTAYDIILNEGSTALEYEPYTGGKPSPSPEYPQPIVSAGEGGEIGLQITGKNLLDPTKLTLKEYNIYYGLPSDDVHFNLIAGINYTLSVPDDATLPNGIYFNNVENVNLAVTFNSRSVSFKPDKNIAVKLDVYWANGRPENDTKLQLEISPTATPYEPYQSQSLILSTPNGLPGIPVDSGGNYTDAEGQQSACDVKDYGTGKYTQMVGHIESYNGENITTPYMSTTGQLSTGAEVYYVLDEPVVTDISADELAAYRALHTYDGTTVVSTAEDVAGLEVKYLADGEKYAKALHESNDVLTTLLGT